MADRPARWHRLDNTANLFPVISGKNYANVYRLSINLRDAVAPDLLQQALAATLPRFAALAVRMRRGLFWHYLEANPGTPLVAEEDDYPCRFIDPRQNGGFLFRVTYFGSRVNLEVFHALTDGTGALRFLQAMVCQYLMLAYPAAFDDEQRARSWFTQHAANTEDGYVANYVPGKKSDFRIGRGLKIRGDKLMPGAMGVVHAEIALPGLKALCKEKGVTISQYLTAVLGWGIFTGLAGERTPRWPANIFVPVNLRNFFESGTSLNFFSNIYISMGFSGETAGFDGLLADVQRQFETKISREGMLEKISYTVGSGYSTLVRVVPLPLKELVLRAIYNASAKSSTMSFTNVGAVRFPEPFEPFVEGVYVLLSPSPGNPTQCATVSYSDTLTLSFTTTRRDMRLQRAVVRKLAGDGLEVTVQSNGVDYESM